MEKTSAAVMVGWLYSSMQFENKYCYKPSSYKTAKENDDICLFLFFLFYLL